MTQFDIYISYAKEDFDWVQELVEEVEQNGLKVCWDIRDFDKDISSHDNRNRLIEKCSSCLLVFSKSYCKRASEWSYFTKFLKKTNSEKHSVTDVLETKAVVCIYLSECNIPSLFSKQKMLKWTDMEYSDIFWQRLIKYLKSAKKKVDVKKALISKFQNVVNSKEDEKEIVQDINSNTNKSSILDVSRSNESVKEIDNTNNNESSSDEHNIPKPISLPEDIASLKNSIAEKTKKMYSHKIEESSKCLKTVQISNEVNNSQKTDVKVAVQEQQIEEIQKVTSTKASLNERLAESADFDNDEKVDSELNTSSYKMFETVYPHLISNSFSAEDEDLTKEDVDKLTLKMEEMETIMLLNEKPAVGSDASAMFDKSLDTGIKQKSEFDSQHEQMQLLDILQSLYERVQNAMDRLTPSIDNLSRKKRYRRVLQRYQECIMKVVNGRKDLVLIQNLPLVSEYLEDIEDQCKCYCCGNLYHSKRALELHLGVCVKETWTQLLKRKSHVKGKF